MNARALFVASLGVATGLLMMCLSSAAAEAAPQRPNILWITCEDISPNLGCYGDRFATTPNLDGLARQGVRYTSAFAAASVCSPARSCLITGVYPPSLGTQHLRSTLPLPDDIRCFPEYLRKVGYYCTNNVKEDYQFKTPPETWDESSRQAHWRKRKPGQPFFSVFNFTTTHQSQVRLRGQQLAARTSRLESHERHDPATIPLPPYYPDTPEVRRDVANLYDMITVMDKQAGDILRQLEEDRLAGDTIVFFYSDHGTGLPRHKRWLYDSGIRVPLIIRFPGKYAHLASGKPGTSVDRLVSFVDFAPTVLSLVGLEIPGYMQGQTFLGPQAGPPRERVYAVRDRVDEVYEMSRAVRDKRFKYIRNYMPHRPVMQHSDYSERTPTRQELRRLAAEGKLAGPPKVLMNLTKPAEELYDTRNDLYEIHNLADSPAHQEVLHRMRDALRSWMLDIHDTGLLPEAEIYSRCDAGMTPYEMTRSPEKFPAERILAAAELVGRDVSTRDKMVTLLADSDSAVRYWAAVGLVALGPEARPAAETLGRALGDPSPHVRFTAAEALSMLDRTSDALPVLIDGLNHDDDWVRLHAAIVLGVVGDRAHAALAELKRAIDEDRPHQATTYVRGALSHAVEKIER